MTIREFRANLSSFLDEADLGNEILVERGSSIYSLVRTGDVPREGMRAGTIVEPEAVAAHGVHEPLVVVPKEVLEEFREECRGHVMRWDCGLKNCNQGRPR